MGETHCLLNELKLFIQSIFPLVIILLILITLSVDCVSVKWILFEENWCSVDYSWLKGLCSRAERS